MTPRRSTLRRFVDWQVRLSRRFDRLLPERYRIDGQTDFQETLLPPRLTPGLTVFDIGGGSRPCLDPEARRRLGIELVGVDIDADELAKAPPGAYDRTIVGDITTLRGAGEADLVICRATLEHVRDTEQAFAGLASFLKPGGRLLLFVPSRNALFARLNLLLPQALKRRLLFAIFPHKGLGHDGFPAFYHRCTPRDFRRMAAGRGLEVEEMRIYFASTYFSFLLPLYLVWRLWILVFHRLAGEQAAETFAMVGRRPDRPTPAGP